MVSSSWRSMYVERCSRPSSSHIGDKDRGNGAALCDTGQGIMSAALTRSTIPRCQSEVSSPLLTMRD
ncbi:hypothetical protein C8Q70DRAFT_1010338, partial [Cubamyces menziesii]